MGATIISAGWTASNPAGDDFELAIGGWCSVLGDAQLAGSATVRCRAFPGHGVTLANHDVIFRSDLKGIGTELAGEIGLGASRSGVVQRRVVECVERVGHRLLHNQVTSNKTCQAEEGSSP